MIATRRFDCTFYVVCLIYINWYIRSSDAQIKGWTVKIWTVYEFRLFKINLWSFSICCFRNSLKEMYKIGPSIKTKKKKINENKIFPIFLGLQVSKVCFIFLNLAAIIQIIYICSREYKRKILQAFE